MNANHVYARVAAMLMQVCTAAFGQQEIGTAFTYQGTLENGSGPVTDTCDFRFGLWNEPAAGAQAGGSPLTIGLVDVVSGSFTASLDFGAGAINGDARWLEIEVQCPGDAGFTLLSPRVELTPVPHATRAVNGVGPSNALEIDSLNGRVGIGTNAPLQPLHVVGAIYAENPGATPLGSNVRLGAPSNDPGLVMERGNGSGGIARRWDIAVESTNFLEFRDTTIAADRMVIDMDGRVGIGTITPGEQLTVAGTVHSTTGGFKFPDGSTQTTAATGGGTGSTLDGAYDQGGPGAGRIITADAGAVEIQGNDGLVVAGTIQSGNSITIDGIANTINSTGDLALQSTGGRVGVGTTTPGEQLTVAGTVHSTTGGFKFPDGSTQTTAVASGGSIPSGSGVLRVSASAVSGLTHYGESFYLATDRWTNEVAPPTPTGLYGAMVAINHMNTLYTMGGFSTPNSLAVTTVRRLAAGSWQSLAPLPDRRGFAGIVNSGPRIYVLGGSREDDLSTPETNSFFEYDTSTNTWTSLINTPQPAWALGATIIGDYLYQIGGFNWGNEETDHVAIAPVHRFDMRFLTWGQVADLPTPRGFLGVADANGLVFAIGGRIHPLFPSDPVGDVEIYDPNTNTWREGTPMPIPAAEFAIEVVDDRIYCIGGISGNRYGSTASGLRIVQEYDTTRDQWTLRAPLPTPRGAASAVIKDSQIWVLHGLESHLCPIEEPGCDTEITNRVDAYQTGREYFLHYKD